MMVQGEPLIHSDTSTESPDRNPGFEAQFHAWGDANEKISIIVNGIVTKSPRTSTKLVVHLRKPAAETTLRTDVLCVNQTKNQNQKLTQQIQNMNESYTSAVQLLTWPRVQRT